MDHFYQKYEGWFDFEDIYREMVEYFPSGSKFVEVGVYRGKSSFFLGVEIVNSEKDIFCYCVDRFTWSEDASYKGYLTKFNEQIGFRGLADVLFPQCGMSVEVAGRFPDESFDFIFIDADHEYESVLADLEAWFPKLKPGGIIGGHDWSNEFPGVERAVREFFGELADETVIQIRKPRSWLVRT